MVKSIGEKIKNLRLQAGYESLGALHRASGVPMSTLSRIESGVQKPRPETLKKLAPYLNVTQEELMAAAGYLDKVDPPKPKALEGLDTFFLRAVGKLSPEGKKKVYDYIEMVDALEKQKRAEQNKKK